jgi:hypothetical protein
MEVTPRGEDARALAAFAIQAGPGTGQELPIHTPVVSIGRGRQNDVVLADDSVSTTHARVEFADGAWRITDLDSANGTFVESERLAAQVPTPLPYGASVRLGAARLHFRPVEGADPDAARASYSEPARQPGIREGGRGGVRIPVWLVVLILVVVALIGMLLFTGPTVVPPAPPATPGAPATAPEAPGAPGAPAGPQTPPPAPAEPGPEAPNPPAGAPGAVWFAPGVPRVA